METRSKSLTFMMAALLMSAGPLTIGGEEGPQGQRSKKVQEHRVYRDICKAAISWIVDGNEPAGAKCDVLADSLLKTDGPSAESYLMAAQVAYLRRRPQNAISILEEVSHRYPDTETRVGQRLPVRVTSQFMIAAIASENGNTSRAKSAYETVLPQLHALHMGEALGAICNLYLAEIDCTLPRSKDSALARLAAIENSKGNDGFEKTIGGLYKKWARFCQAKMLGKPVPVELNAEANTITDSSMVAVFILELNGMAGSLLADNCADIRINRVIQWMIEQHVKNTSSSLDRELVRLAYGYDQYHRGNHEEAERYYAPLFAEKSFFSPVAGVQLARSKIAQGKAGEADDLLQEIRVRYPGFESLARAGKSSPK